MESYDLIVIGGGSGGLTASGAASQLGAKTALIESRRLGGDCLWTGCVPSKAFIKAARVAHLIEQADRFGLQAIQPCFDFAHVMDHVWDVIHTIEPHDSPDRLRDLGIAVVFGSPRFVNPHEIEVNGERFHADRFVIATGSRPLVPPIEGINEAGCLTNETLFYIRTLPRRLVIVGGGPIGVEMGQAFARFGSEVTLVEMLDRILPKEDPDVSAAIGKVLAREGLNILTGTTVVNLARAGEEKIVTVERNGAREKITCDDILMAIGRRPNVERLGLDRAGVKVEKTGIVIDRRCRTTARHIYAVGDVTGHYLFTHMADYQAKVAISNAILHLPVKLDYRAVPWVTFTDPEVARVGLSEAEARERGIRAAVYRWPFSEVDRAVTEGESDGFIKVIASQSQVPGLGGRILGAHIVGPKAGELIAEVTLAMQNRIRLPKIANTIHPYPTLALGNRQAADLFFIDLLSPRLVGLIQQLFGYRGSLPRREQLKPKVEP